MATLDPHRRRNRGGRADRRRARLDPRPAARPRPVRAQGAAGAAARRARGPDLDLWRGAAEAVRPDAGRRQRDLGDRSDRAALDQRRQGPAEDGQLCLFGEFRGGACRRGRSSASGGSGPTASCSAARREISRRRPAFRLHVGDEEQAGRPADRVGGRAGRDAGVSRAALMRCSRISSWPITAIASRR